MTREIDYFKMVTGETFEEFTKLPDFDEIIRQQISQDSSRYPLRLLGHGQKDVFISEEEREVNFHILGAPGEGKSKFLEHNIRLDIDNGLGLCLLDPSEGGDTVRNVLSYCEAIGHEKVILIDPATIQKFDKIPTLAPLSPKRLKASTDGVMEALSILFGAKNDTDTPRIKRYLSALLRVLAKSNLTLYESRYYATFWEGKKFRDQIATMGGNFSDLATLRNVFKSEYAWENYFSSTINRLDALWQFPLSAMLGNTEGINFVKAVSEGWVILVNLSPYHLTQTEARLLGIIVISQLIQAVDILVNNHWRGVYYLYMDEAGRFATPQLDALLSYKRKSGLRLVLAHHYFEQFEDKKVLNSIMNNARIKVMFDTPSYDDRMKMIKALGYGGDIPPLLANFANQNIPKQYAIIRKNKETPVRVKIPQVAPYPPVSDEYLKKILSQPFYKSRYDYSPLIVPSDPDSPPPGEAPDGQTNNKAPVPRGGRRKGVPKGVKKPPVSKGDKPLKI